MEISCIFKKIANRNNKGSPLSPDSMTTGQVGSLNTSYTLTITLGGSGTAGEHERDSNVCPETVHRNRATRVNGLWYLKVRRDLPDAGGPLLI